MELQASRIGARIGPAGEPVLLTDQDRLRWDRRLDEARAEFTRAAGLTSNERERALFRARAAECEQPNEA